MSGDLAAFLAARLGEKEAWARNLIADWEPPAIWHSLGQRMLREAAAGRKILAEHGAGSDPCDAHNASLESIPCPTLEHLAAVWSDHPGYRQEWAPTPATRAGS